MIPRSTTAGSLDRPGFGFRWVPGAPHGHRPERSSEYQLSSSPARRLNLQVTQATARCCASTPRNCRRPAGGRNHEPITAPLVPPDYGRRAGLCARSAACRPPVSGHAGGDPVPAAARRGGADFDCPKPSRGYASLTTNSAISGGTLVKLDVLINGDKVDALALIAS